MSKRFNRDDIDKFHDYSLYIPQRTIYIGSEQFDVEGNESGVDGLMAERTVKNISLLDSTSKDPITIIMNNPGGDWYHGIAIYDAIKTAKSHVTVKVYGMAMSMGAIILQAADERILAPNSRIMIHYGYMGMESNHPKIYQKWSRESEKLDALQDQILLEKIRERDPNFSLKRLQKMLDFDTILNAKEAVELGLADKVMGDE